MKVKFNLDDDLPLQKTLQLHNMIIFVKATFQEDNKYYPTFFMNECSYKLKMIYFDRIDISEGFDANKTNASDECDICLYQCILDIGFKFQLYVCDECHGYDNIY